MVPHHEEPSTRQLLLLWAFVIAFGLWFMAVVFTGAMGVNIMIAPVGPIRPNLGGP